MVAAPEAPQSPKYQPQLIRSQLAPQLDELFHDFVQELTGDKNKVALEELIEMVRSCPLSRAAIELKALRAAVALGEYHHSDPNPYPTASGYMTIQEWVRGNFESMRGSLHEAAGKIIRQAYGLGSCCSEIIWTKKTTTSRTEWRLGAINTLNPLRYNFAGRLGRIDRLIYRPLSSSPIPIPYNKILHVYTPMIEEPDDPRGDPQSARAYPYYKARQLMLKQWTVAGQRQATGLLVIQAPSEETVVMKGKDGKALRDKDGKLKTRSAVEAAVEAGRDIENGSIYGTDIKNKVFSIPGSAGENFFNIALMYFGKMVLYSYGVPSTIFDDTASGIGNAGVNAGHRLILDSQIEAIVATLRDELLEKVVRPLLVVNFGDRFNENIGEFRSEKFLDPSMAATRVNNLTIAITNGIVDATDLEAINRLREDLGLSPLSKQQFDEQQLAKLIKEQEAQQYNQDTVS